MVPAVCWWVSPRDAAGASRLTTACPSACRYDALLRGLWSPAAYAVVPPPGATGISLNIERLARRLHQQQQQQLGASSPASSSSLLVPELQSGSQAEVLVCSKGNASDGLLEARMQLVAQLWAADIKAELVPKAAPSLTEQFDYANMRSSIKWLVILKAAAGSSSSSQQAGHQHSGSGAQAAGGLAVKVKSLERRSEEAVALGDVVRYLQLAISGAQDPGRSLLAGGGGGSGSKGGMLGKEGPGADLERAEELRAEPSSSKLDAAAASRGVAGGAGGRAAQQDVLGVPLLARGSGELVSGSVTSLATTSSARQGQRNRNR